MKKTIYISVIAGILLAPVTRAEALPFLLAPLFFVGKGAAVAKGTVVASAAAKGTAAKVAAGKLATGKAVAAGKATSAKASATTKVQSPARQLVNEMRTRENLENMKNLKSEVLGLGSDMAEIIVSRPESNERKKK